ncbi:CARDB domain-containing protein [Halovivax asiaticus JCM 14624]|uniref:CARDB domain-containing protein n=1 Tax=Halovivax asiaticus JCM 14624 TaxID=1227490 RepID=M0BQP0_9EURY|nr:hypothetical protein [Halovivax asiaticus]ELZ11974.1 CARDB domain-containing protein [Halovivax asiaticus JCM 14624]
MAKHFSRRSTIASGFATLATATLAGCLGDIPTNDPNGTDSDGDSATDEDAARLYTARDELVGTVSIAQEGSHLTVAFETGDSPWTISQASLHVGSADSDIPRNDNGNPHVHQFERVTQPDSPTDTIEFADVGIDDGLEQVVVAGHAVVQREFQTTDVWAGTKSIPDTADWARYFEHDLTASEQPRSDVPGMRGRIVTANGDPGADDQLDVLGPQDGSPEFDTTYTDENGAFHTMFTEPGTYSLGYNQRVQRETNTPERDGSPDIYSLDPVEVGDEVLELGTIELPDAHVLDVRVVDDAGTPIAGAPVNFLHRDSWEIGRGQQTNADGYFQYENLDVTGIELHGAVRIQVWEPGVDPEPGNYAAQRQIELDGPRTEEFVLDRGAGELAITGTISGPDGELATGDRVQIRGPRRSNEHPTKEYRTTTDHGGYFSAEVENPGAYALGYIQEQDGDPTSPERDGMPDIYHFDLVDIDGVVDLGDVELPQAHVLDVRVVDASGNPVEGAHACVWSCSPDGSSCWGSAPRETNADGYFQYDGLGESGAELVGDITIQVWSPDVADPGFDNIADEREIELTESRTEEFVVDG